MLDDNEECKDVLWKSVDDNKVGKINFRRQKNKIKTFFKMISLILIACISGALTSLYVFDKKYSQELKTNQSSLMSKKNDDSYSNDEESIISKVAEKVSPSVVGITNSDKDVHSENIKSGSGIIFKSDGYIVTNYGIVKNTDNIKVRLANNSKTLKAKFIGGDVASGVAVIKIDAKNLPIADFGDSSKIRIGDLTIAIGNPIGEEYVGFVTVGIISGLNRKTQYEGSKHKIIQTDTIVNPKNNGGALCNSKGEVIGISNYELTQSNLKNFKGMSVAIAINEVSEIINQIIKNGETVTPCIGVEAKRVVKDKDGYIKGLYVQEVIKGSGAELAGIRPTDILSQVDGKKIASVSDLLNITINHKIGDTVKCKILRNGKTIEINVVFCNIDRSK